MDTAPRDGREILIWNGKTRAIAKWNEDRHAAKPRPFFNYTPFRVSESRALPPLAWTDLPEPPLLPPATFGVQRDA